MCASLTGRRAIHIRPAAEHSIPSCAAPLLLCRRNCFARRINGIRFSTLDSCTVHSSLAAVHRPHIACQAAKTAAAAAAAADDLKEAHKIFDEAFITVKSGAGGSGEIVEAGRGKYVRNNKYHLGANQPKQIWLPASDPADGADGADVYVVCDPAFDSLLHLHKRKQWFAAKGAQGNPAVGSAGPKRNTKIKKAVTPPLEVPVPPGTVVKRKGSGQVLGEVIQPGDRILVAKGGKGGMGVRAPSRTQKQRELQKEIKNAEKSGGEVVAIEDVNWKDDAKGLPGQQLGLQLLLRVVADVGIVGFPNAGKSSLLSALTRASPEVAPYPFTTLMPNLGVMAAGQGPVLADLPGLIEGAHTGKGLGRMFLRHLRRTRVLLHVVDASAADPATDYLAVREELRMYNPDYVRRPHVVGLNKMDLDDAGALRQEVADEVMAAAHQLQEQHSDIQGFTVPAAVVPCSAVSGEGMQQLAAALQAALEQLDGGVLRQGQEHLPRLQETKDTTAVRAAAAAAAVLAGTAAAGSAATEDEETGDWDAAVEVDEWQEGEEGEWEDASSLLAEARQGGTGSSSTDQQQQGGNASSDDESPPALSKDDPDIWLFALPEEELLELADKAE